MIHTKNEPEGVLPLDDGGGYVDVPTQDLRALRRAVLDIDEFLRAEAETLSNESAPV
jgi:hypothetical protein